MQLNKYIWFFNIHLYIVTLESSWGKICSVCPFLPSNNLPSASGYVQICFYSSLDSTFVYLFPDKSSAWYDCIILPLRNVPGFQLLDYPLLILWLTASTTLYMVIESTWMVDHELWKQHLAHRKHSVILFCFRQDLSWLVPTSILKCWDYRHDPAHSAHDLRLLLNDLLCE